MMRMTPYGVYRSRLIARDASRQSGTHNRRCCFGDVFSRQPDTAASIAFYKDGKVAQVVAALLYIFVTSDILLHWGETTLQSLLSLQCSFWLCNLLNLITCLCVDHIGTISVIW